jgi:hypothetical protein
MSSLSKVMQNDLQDFLKFVFVRLKLLKEIAMKGKRLLSKHKEGHVKIQAS